MNQAQKLEELRELFLSAPESEATRALAIGVSLALFAAVLWLVRRGRLREEYTPLWMGTAAVLILISLRFDVLSALTRAVGAWTQSATIFFLGEVFLVAVCLNYGVRLSRAGLQIKNLAQEVALLRAELARMSERRGA
jgi:hypothetical protein